MKSIALAALLAFSIPGSPTGGLECEIPPIAPIPPIGCADLIPLCVCDQSGNCRIVWHCVRA
jgi:hypothetical protein